MRRRGRGHRAGQARLISCCGDNVTTRPAGGKPNLSFHVTSLAGIRQAFREPVFRTLPEVARAHTLTCRIQDRIQRVNSLRPEVPSRNSRPPPGRSRCCWLGCHTRSRTYFQVTGIAYNGIGLAIV